MVTSCLAFLAGSFPIVSAIYLSHGGTNPIGGPCRFQQIFGFPAPSCGLTRSFIALVQGDIGGAVMQHLFGPVIFLSFALIALQGFSELLLKRPLPIGYRWVGRPRQQLYSNLLVLVAGFFIYYAIRLYARYHLTASSFHSEWLQSFIAGAQQL
ncbi:MAG: DUF2752 domain-containing protein [Cyanobacteria bacterium J06627_28]